YVSRSLTRQPCWMCVIHRALRVSAELTCKHLANPARAYRRTVPELDALVIAARNQLIDRDIKRGSQQEYLIEPGSAQACLELADGALAPGGESATLQAPGGLLLRQALTTTRLGEALTDQLMHLHPPSICEQSR